MLKQALISVSLLILLTSCGSATPTGNTRNDLQAAQNLLPNINGYTRYDVDNVLDALTAAGGGAALTSGNLPVAGAIAKIDQMVQCYQDVGAVAANTYVQLDVSSIIGRGGIPSAGVVAVINQTRVVDNFLSCALGSGSNARAQSAELEPCSGSGSFVYQGDTITYLYAATDFQLCQYFQQHFNNLRNTP